MRKDNRVVTEGPTNCKTLGYCCSTRNACCKHLNTYDFHYHYCGALPDTSPGLRPGGGSRIWDQCHPDCPFFAIAHGVIDEP